MEIGLRKYEGGNVKDDGYYNRTKFGRITIHDNSFIGVNSIIQPDVEIGPNAIVADGSVVTKNILPNTVVAGFLLE